MIDNKGKIEYVLSTVQKYIVDGVISLKKLDEISAQANLTLDDKKVVYHSLCEKCVSIDDITKTKYDDSYLKEAYESYYDYLKSIPLLKSKEEEWELSKKIQDWYKIKDKQPTSPEEKEQFDKIIQTGKQARHKLIESNLRLVVSIAKKYLNKGLEIMDVIQEGNQGLMKAVDLFDYTKGFKFATYATNWIHYNIVLATGYRAGIYLKPYKVLESIKKVRKIRCILEQELERTPTMKEIADRAGMSEQKVEELYLQGFEHISLEKPVGEDGDSVLGDFIKDESIPPVEEKVDRDFLRAKIDEIMGLLTEKEKYVIQSYYGYKMPQKTLTEIGQEFKLSKERIRQIREGAEKKLKEEMIKNNLGAYIGIDPDDL